MSVRIRAAVAAVASPISASFCRRSKISP